MYGIQLDETTKDLKIVNGAMVVGEVSEQNQYVILTVNKGEIKETPTLGIGIDTYTNDNNTDELKHSIRENFRMDGLTIRKMSIEQGKININADYN